MPFICAVFTAIVALQPVAAADAPFTPGGTIGVERPAPPRDRGAAAADGATAEAIESALVDAGFTVIPSARNARHVARYTLTRVAKGSALAKGARSPAIGMPGGVNGMGAGVSIALGGGKMNVGTMVETQMALTITRRGESGPAWEGRAVTYGVTGTSGDDPATVARKLAAALTRNFAAPSGVLVSVP
ncbi:hypothetical protein ASE86_12120 [Sphingomonas sp. Leaf33]|uniref:hypothetical protein n=1 Tax=Sphingomonas sp. Leaf33 TaxID=1736215 RepID=UPI00070194E2|nr:hypothetical protein [Sphingomonas sp. Leaf33]KQN19255.1 hypothetical protein ASE86_12120 [Sphingomonas sp. Leaf33]